MRSALSIKLDKRVERGCFTRTGTARDDHVQTGRDSGLQISCHFFRKGTKIDQIIDAKLVFFELTNGNQRAINRNRGHHRVETRAIGKTGVNIGVRFIDATTHSRDDLVDDPHQVLFIFEGDVAQLQLTERVPQRSAAGR